MKIKKSLMMFVLVLTGAVSSASAAGFDDIFPGGDDPTPVTPTVSGDFSKIKHWVGSGQYQSALVINWIDNTGNSTALVWGYKHDTSYQSWNPGSIIASDVVNAILASDSRLSATGYYDDAGKFKYTGFHYDFNNDGQLEVEYSPLGETITENIWDAPEGLFALEQGVEVTAVPGADLQIADMENVNSWNFRYTDEFSTDANSLPTNDFWVNLGKASPDSRIIANGVAIGFTVNYEDAVPGNNILPGELIFEHPTGTPEPATMLLLCAGGALMLRKKSRKSAAK